MPAEPGTTVITETASLPSSLVSAHSSADSEVQSATPVSSCPSRLCHSNAPTPTPAPRLTPDDPRRPDRQQTRLASDQHGYATPRAHRQTSGTTETMVLSVTTTDHRPPAAPSARSPTPVSTPEVRVATTPAGRQSPSGDPDGKTAARPAGPEAIQQPGPLFGDNILPVQKYPAQDENRREC